MRPLKHDTKIGLILSGYVLSAIASVGLLLSNPSGDVTLTLAAEVLTGIFLSWFWYEMGLEDGQAVARKSFKNGTFTVPVGGHYQISMTLTNAELAPKKVRKPKQRRKKQ